MWIVLIVFIVLGMMVFSESNKPRSNNAKETIKQRYARGEIDKDTYNKMRSTLEND